MFSIVSDNGHGLNSNDEKEKNYEKTLTLDADLVRVALPLHAVCFLSVR